MSRNNDAAPGRDGPVGGDTNRDGPVGGDTNRDRLLGGDTNRDRLLGGDADLGRIETEVALLMRLGEATRRGTGTAEHRLLDRAAYVILRHLAAAGPQNISALAARLNLDGSTVTRQVSAMQRDGLITRGPDPQDGRGTVVTPTAAGQHRMAAVQAARSRVYGEILAGWSADDRRNLADLLGRLNEALDRYIRPG